MNLKDLEPNLRDEVRSKIAPDTTGMVIAKYPVGPKKEAHLDIRLFNEKIYYRSPAKNWEVVTLNNE
ncbi:MAG: hypothetical protein PHT30_05930 [Bacilli bacterium]|nr:hypothetical protein [Bacilli bacterium]